MIKLQLQVSVRFNESLRHLVVQVVKVTGDKDVYVPHNFEHVQPLKKTKKRFFAISIFYIEMVQSKYFIFLFKLVP